MATSEEILDRIYTKAVSAICDTAHEERVVSRTAWKALQEIRSFCMEVRGVSIVGKYEKNN